MKKSKLIIVLLLTVLSIFIINFFIPFPINMDKKVNGIEISLEDKSSVNPVTMNIKGVYYYSLLGNNSFRGYITFDGWNLSQGNTVTQLEFSDGHAVLYYKNLSDFDLLGELYTGVFPKNFVILVNSMQGNGSYGWNSETGHCIIGPASNRDEAAAIYRTVAEKTKLNYPELIELKNK